LLAETEVLGGLPTMAHEIISARFAAFHNVGRFIKTEAFLPERVVGTEWTTTRFFEADTVVSKDFVSAVHEFVKIEQSESCCLVNLTRTHVPEYQKASSLFIERTTTEEEYSAKLREGGPASGWIFWMDRYGCASDKGEWCLYCERNNDVALISFRGPDAARKYHSPLKILRAEPIESLLRVPELQVVPFISLTPGWRSGLKENYGSIGIVR
jgi:hypothetical protein